MKSHMIQTAMAAALSAALLVSGGAAMAADEAAPLDTAPVDAAYTITARNSAQPIRLAGKAVELGEASVTIEDDSGSGAYSKVVVNVAEDTAIVDGATGQAVSFADIAQGDYLYAWVGPAMTRSLPPISTARVIVCNVPQDAAAPSYSEILDVQANEEGGVSLYVTNDMILHLSSQTQLMPYRTRNIVGLDDLKPGDRVLAWYELVMMSLPGQAVPERVVVLPPIYDGYASADGLTVSVNGQALDLPGKAEDGRLMAPLRAFAEALGCEVTWEPGTNLVSVKQGDQTLYYFTIGSDEVVQDGDMVVALLAPADAADGVTYMALEDLANLHDLKLAERFF